MMRVIRASLRLSLFGGGCDLPDYYSRYGATIISAALSQSVFLVHNNRPTGGYRLSYSQVEELQHLSDARHSLVRQAVIRYGEPSPCTLSIISDVPAGTGLGSSGALSVCLTAMFYPGKLAHCGHVAREAFELERSVAPVGVQDHLPAAFGGTRVYHIDENGRVEAGVREIGLEKIVHDYGLLLYTDQTHDSAPLLKSSWANSDRLAAIHDLAQSAEQELKTMTASRLGELLAQGWRIKRSIDGIADKNLLRQYDAAIDAGAIGGRLLGSGGGGCWFFIVDRPRRSDVISATGLREIPIVLSAIGHNEMFI